MNAVTHKIGGIVFRTELNAWLPRILDEPFGLFRIEETMPDVHQFISIVNLNSGELPRPTNEEMQNLFECDHFSQDWLNNPFFRSREVLDRLKCLPGLGEQVEIWVEDHHLFIRDFSRNRIDIYYTKKNKGYPPDHPAAIPEYHVAANLQQILATFLPHFSAILLHSAGVIRGAKSALFFAPDGGGKTTVLAQSKTGPILSDDHIILKNEGGGIVAHGTPLGTMTSGFCRASIGALFLLKKAGRFRLESIAPAELVQWLWTEHRNYTFFLPKRLKKRAFEILSHACRQAPAYRMHFPKDYVDWDAIDAAMR